MQNPAIVPGTRKDTPHVNAAEFRPPFLAECVKQLGDLERWFGTQLLADAVDRLNRDRDYQARLRTIRPDDSKEAAAVGVLRAAGSNDLADQIAAGEADAKPQPAATPFPGVHPTRPTAARAA